MNRKGICGYDGKSCDMFRAFEINPEDISLKDSLEIRLITLN